MKRSLFIAVSAVCVAALALTGAWLVSGGSRVPDPTGCWELTAIQSGVFGESASGSVRLTFRSDGSMVATVVPPAGSGGVPSAMLYSWHMRGDSLVFRPVHGGPERRLRASVSGDQLLLTAAAGSSATVRLVCRRAPDAGDAFDVSLSSPSPLIPVSAYRPPGGESLVGLPRR